MLCIDVSIIVLLVSGAIVPIPVSVVVLVESEEVELDPLLQAANVPIAKTINSFFIVCVFCDVIYSG